LSSEDVQRVRAVNQGLHHRGPDGEGEYQATHIALAMRRLSIIDLAGGWQPLYNEDQSLALVANGEIYNFVELRHRLEGRGHKFRTASDCETILHLYEDHGLDCVQHLRGMFAFALWDTKRRRLLLARDRMGEKPLYLYEVAGGLLFASELKAILRSGLVPFELDPRAVNLFFHYQYVPEPATPIKGLRKLPAGHLMTVEADPWRLEERCYWRMEDAPPLDGDPVELIRTELERVSELVVRSDVPVGVALSGGLDSSAVAALAVKKYPGTIHAFSVGYPGRPPNDERRDAEGLARQLGMPFHDIEMETDPMVKAFPEMVYARDDPIADISGYGYYSVMKLAREHGVPVVLQGQGGDELFWGYSWVQQAVIESREKEKFQRERWLALPQYLRWKFPTRRGLRAWLGWARDLAGLRTGWRRFRRHAKGGESRLVFYDLSEDYRLASETAGGLYGPAFEDQVFENGAAELFTLPLPWPNLDVTLTRLICGTYLLENGVAQGDRLGMASSVELRLPLLDYRLVETVIGLRKARSDLSLPPKSWLKAALKDVLPEWVMNRPKKGFAPPILEWHRCLFAAHGEALRDGFLVKTGILSSEAASQLAAGPFPPTAVAPLSFKALVLEWWCRRMADACSQGYKDHELRQNTDCILRVQPAATHEAGS
jgi:asparagine synthase (glutamine-hydrolysing)